MRTPLFVAALSLLLGCSTAPKPVPAREHTFRVVTYNVNFGLAGETATLEAIGAADADLVALQETTPAWEAALRSRFADRYPHMAFLHSSGAGGSALLSRWPFEWEALPNPGRWFPAMRAVVETPVGKIQVLNVHLRPPVSDSGSVVSGYFSTGSYRRTEAESFGAHLVAGLPTLVLGDFNESSGDALELMTEQRQAKDAVSERAGSTATWRWPVGGITLRSQLDHVLYAPPLALIDLEVREAGNSDHLPIVATFAIEE